MGGEDPSLAGLSGAGKLVDEALRLEPDLVSALVLRAALINNEYDVDPNADRDRIAREQDRLNGAGRAARFDRSGGLGLARRRIGVPRSMECGARSQRDRDQARPLRDQVVLPSRGPHDPDGASERSAWRWPIAHLFCDPGSAMATAVACEVHVLTGRTEEAIAACEKASGRVDYWPIHLALAAAYANHGEMAKAVAAKAEVLRIIPGLTIAQLRAKRASDNPEYQTLAETYWYEGLRKAGLPEK